MEGNMEKFKFIKPKAVLHQGFIDDFNRRFGNIAEDTMLMLSAGKYDDPVLTSYRDLVKRGFDLSNHESLLDFNSEEYYRKEAEYENFIDWVDKKNKNYNSFVIGEFQCPYLKTSLSPVYLRFSYEAVKKYIKLESDREKNSIQLFKMKPMDIYFNVHKSDKLEDFMDRKVIDILMEHWKYDVSEEIDLNGTDDGSIVTFSGNRASVYYKDLSQVLSNTVYVGPKGLYVKKKSTRLMISTPHYPSINTHIDGIIRNGSASLNKSDLPSYGERISQAILAGSLPSSLEGPTSAEQKEIVHEIKEILRYAEDESKAYEQIAVLMKSHKK